jgi:hypothetical protein
LDAYSRRLVGWQLASHMRTDLVLDALKMALGTRRPGAEVQLVHHSDRGSQYTSIDYSQTLTDHQVLASVGSVGDAYDNALAESFVDSFKTELIKDRVWRTRSQLELAVVEYSGWYNHSRLHESLGYLPPAEYEQQTEEQLRSQKRAREPTNQVPAKPGPAHRPASRLALQQADRLAPNQNLSTRRLQQGSRQAPPPIPVHRSRRATHCEIAGPDEVAADRASPVAES